MTNKQKIAIGINIFTAITQLVVSSILIIRRGFAAFGYYTMDSNIFAAVTSIFLIITSPLIVLLRLEPQHTLPS